MILKPSPAVQPSSGSIEYIEYKDLSDTWSYFSVGNHSAILPATDGQFGHMFAFGVDREAARQVYDMNM